MQDLQGPDNIEFPVAGVQQATESYRVWLLGVETGSSARVTCTQSSLWHPEGQLCWTWDPWLAGFSFSTLNMSDSCLQAAEVENHLIILLRLPYVRGHFPCTGFKLLFIFDTDYSVCTNFSGLHDAYFI